MPPDDPIFSPDQQPCRWSHLKKITPPTHEAVRDHAFPFMKTLSGGTSYARDMKSTAFMITQPVKSRCAGEEVIKQRFVLLYRPVH
jgi:hypothetical protein